MKNVPLLLSFALFAAAFGDAAKAGDAPPTKASGVLPFYDWTGAYVGGHVGYTRGGAWVTVTDPDVAQFRQPLGSLTGGLQAGYNYLLPSRFLLGVEVDVSFPNYLAADDVASAALRRARPSLSCRSAHQNQSTLAARVEPLGVVGCQFPIDVGIG